MGFEPTGCKVWACFVCQLRHADIYIKTVWDTVKLYKRLRPPTINQLLHSSLNIWHWFAGTTPRLYYLRTPWSNRLAIECIAGISQTSRHLSASACVIHIAADQMYKLELAIQWQSCAESLSCTLFLSVFKNQCPFRQAGQRYYVTAYRHCADALMTKRDFPMKIRAN